MADTPAHLSAHLLERAVDVTMLAGLGSKASDVIDDQLEHVEPGTDIVVLCVGANDVASRVARRVYATQIDHILTALAPTPVVMLTLPDMAMPDRMGQPLRSLAGVRARYFEAARARVAARHDHVVSVDIASRPAASAAPPVAGCSAPIGSIPPLRATACGRSASRTPAARSSNRRRPLGPTHPGAR